MKGWNPFSKVDMEIGSFIKKSTFNKEYASDNIEERDKKKIDKNNK
ncbi:MAG: hypothetical protein Q8920_07710 [Bacillota bacterium]|nr:hypothetical protein [Bacillota bacterium]